MKNTSDFDLMPNSFSVHKKIKEYVLYQTSLACPQSFSVYKDKEEIAYLRVRHGFFAVWVNKNCIYRTPVLGDGLFDDEEEDLELNIAIEKIDEYYKSIL